MTKWTFLKRPEQSTDGARSLLPTEPNRNPGLESRGMTRVGLRRAHTPAFCAGSSDQWCCLSPRGKNALDGIRGKRPALGPADGVFYLAQVRVPDKGGRDAGMTDHQTKAELKHAF